MTNVRFIVASWCFAFSRLDSGGVKKFPEFFGFCTGGKHSKSEQSGRLSSADYSIVFYEGILIFDGAQVIRLRNGITKEMWVEG
jgi:hypothetical protein